MGGTLSLCNTSKIEKRKLVIPPEESGWSKKQVFTSKCLPYEIPYEFIRFVRFPDGSVYPKYKANVVTKTKLKLFGRLGYENGIRLIDKIVWWLTWQEGMLETKSIKKSDLRAFDYKKERFDYTGEDFSYWVSSSCAYYFRNALYLGPGYVLVHFDSAKPNYGSRINYNDYQIIGCSLFEPDGDEAMCSYALRPVMTLESKVEFGNQDNII